MTVDAGESAVFEKRAADAAAPGGGAPDDADAVPDAVERFDVYYSCLRCGTVASSAEISRLPEIKCICGFKVFTKIRPPVVKTINAV